MTPIVHTFEHAREDHPQTKTVQRESDSTYQRPLTAPQRNGNGACCHHGRLSCSTRDTHLTQWYPRPPGTTRRTGAPWPTDSGVPPRSTASSRSSDSGRRRRYPVRLTTCRLPVTPSGRSRGTRAPAPSCLDPHPPVQSSTTDAWSPKARSSSTVHRRPLPPDDTVTAHVDGSPSGATSSSHEVTGIPSGVPEDTSYEPVTLRDAPGSASAVAAPCSAAYAAAVPSASPPARTSERRLRSVARSRVRRRRTCAAVRATAPRPAATCTCSALSTAVPRQMPVLCDSPEASASSTSAVSTTDRSRPGRRRRRPRRAIADFHGDRTRTASPTSP